MGTWSPPTQFWRRHGPWVIPAGLLLVIVLVLGIVWHNQVAPPAFEKLQIPDSLKSERAVETSPNPPTAVAPNG